MKKIFTALALCVTIALHAQTNINGAVVSLTNGKLITTISTDSSVSVTTGYLAVVMFGPIQGSINVSFTLYRSQYAYNNGIVPQAASIPQTYCYAMPAPDGIQDFALTYSEPLMKSYLSAQGFTVIKTF